MIKFKPADGGFTLIEVLITLTIISILTAIALPQYNDYKRQAFDIRAISDLRNVALAEEAYFMQVERYLSCDTAGCVGLPGIAAISAGVKLKVDATAEGFTATASHPRGTGTVFKWDSLKGGIQN